MYILQKGPLSKFQPGVSYNLNSPLLVKVFFQSLLRFITIGADRNKNRFKNRQFCGVWKLLFYHCRAIKLTQNCVYFINIYISISLFNFQSLVNTAPNVLELLHLLQCIAVYLQRAFPVTNTGVFTSFSFTLLLITALRYFPANLLFILLLSFLADKSIQYRIVLSCYQSFIERQTLDFVLIFIRHPRQRFVWFCEESPWVVRWHTGKDLTQYNNGFFNWTMTYRRDADIHKPYGVMHDIYEDLSKGKQAVDKILDKKVDFAISR